MADSPLRGQLLMADGKRRSRWDIGYGIWKMKDTAERRGIPIHEACRDRFLVSNPNRYRVSNEPVHLYRFFPSIL